MDSDSEISKSPYMAKGAGGKTGKYKGKLVRPKDIHIDSDFFNGENVKAMKNALYAKFSQNDDLKNLLLATKNAKLVHFSRGSPPIVMVELMKVRKQLENE